MTRALEHRSMVNTKKVSGRRLVKLSTLDDVVADARRVAEADRAGRLKPIGNWTAGQVFSHLAAWIEYPFDGFPPEVRAAWWLKALARVFKRRLISGPMIPGVHIPGIAGGTLGAERVSTEEGLARLTGAVERLKLKAPPLPSPVFGPMTHAEWTRLHLSHAELHLSFLVL